MDPFEYWAAPNEIDKAQEIYQSDNVEIDSPAKASRTDDGLWVAAWVWVSYEDL